MRLELEKEERRELHFLSAAFKVFTQSDRMMNEVSLRFSRCGHRVCVWESKCMCVCMCVSGGFHIDFPSCQKCSTVEKWQQHSSSRWSFVSTGRREQYEVAALCVFVCVWHGVHLFQSILKTQRVHSKTLFLLLLPLHHVLLKNSV